MNYSLQLAPTTSLTTMQGQSVLFSKRTGDFYGLNPTAKYLVEQLLATDFESTASEAAKQFGVEEAVLRSDIEELVTELSSAALVVRLPAPGK